MPKNFGEILLIYGLEKLDPESRARLIGTVANSGLVSQLVHSGNVSVKRTPGELRELVAELPAEFEYGLFGVKDLHETVVAIGQKMGKSEQWVSTNTTRWWSAISSRRNEKFIGREYGNDGSLQLSLDDTVQMMKKIKIDSWNRIGGNYGDWVSFSRGLAEAMTGMAYARVHSLATTQAE